jgi:hypothetical protein
VQAHGKSPSSRVEWVKKMDTVKITVTAVRKWSRGSPLYACFEVAKLPQTRSPARSLQSLLRFILSGPLSCIFARHLASDAPFWGSYPRWLWHKRCQHVRYVTHNHSSLRSSSLISSRANVYQQPSLRPTLAPRQTSHASAALQCS